VFFFSSRRRHTRSTRDWSSDVCSSDLGFFKPLLDDFSAQITAFKNAKVEIVTGVLIPPDFTTFWTQARQQGFRPKAVTVGKALLFPRSVEALGPTGDGLTTEVWWSPNHP